MSKAIKKSKGIATAIEQKPVATSVPNPLPVRKPKVVLPKRVAFTFVLVVALGGAMFFYFKYQDAKKQANTTQEEKLQSESTNVLERLKKVILITEADTPTVARTEDIAILQSSNPEFYKYVQTGDYVIIFPTRAIIYRASVNQIINVAPILKTAEPITSNDVSKP